MRARSRWILVLVGLAFGVAAGLVFRQEPRQNPIRVTSAKGWKGQGTQTTGIVPYLWLSDHEVLYFKSNDPLVAVRRDTRTGKDTPLAIRTPPDIAPAKGYPQGLSPDRKWLLWANERGKRPTVVASAVDGSKAVNWRIWPESFVFWTADSRRFVHMYSRTAFDPMNGKTTAVAGYWGVQNMPFPLGAGPSGSVIAVDGHSEYYQRTEMGLVNFLFHPVPKTATLLELDSTRWDAPRRSFTVPLPSVQDKYLCYLTLSPEGKRLGWMAVSQRLVRGALFWLPRPLQHWYQTRTTTFWIADLAGSAPRLIGTVYTSDMYESTPDPPKWTPDGKRLSFLWKDALWTLPTD